MMTTTVTVHAYGKFGDDFHERELELLGVPRIGETLIMMWSGNDELETRTYVVKDVAWIIDDGMPSRVQIDVVAA